MPLSIDVEDRIPIRRVRLAVPIEAASAEDTKRLLWRISVRGLPKVYAHLAA